MPGGGVCLYRRCTVGRQPGVRYAINSHTRRTAQDISISISTSIPISTRGAPPVAFLLKVTTKPKQKLFLFVLLFVDMRGTVEREGGGVARFPHICVCDLALGMWLMASTNAWDAT